MYSINAAELAFGDVLRPLLIAILFAILVAWILHRVFGDALKAALTASLFILVFYLFGDLSDWLKIRLGWGPVRTDFILLAVMSAGMLAWGWQVSRGLKHAGLVHTYFTWLGILFFVNTTAGLLINLKNDGAFTRFEREPAIVHQPASASNRPDVYYIILDAYGRQDILQEYYNYDNSEIVTALQSRGFYIAEQSNSNYIQTMLSLTSSLNMEYVQTLTEQGSVPENRYGLIDVLQHSELRRILSENGYQMISFNNEYKATVPDAEIFHDDTGSGILHPITAFESIVLNHTLARVLLVWRPLNDALVGMPYRMHAQTILSTFERLPAAADLQGDQFVYAHIIAPHPPFVFDETGTLLEHHEPFTLNDANYYIRDHSRKGYIAGYRRQIQYINSLLLKTVDAILLKSTTPPIIIIQGDHGPGAYLHWGSLDSTIPAERFGILNAYYFPDQDYGMLYSEISPVNSFRVVLNQYFDGEYQLLPDRHYYSTWSYPFEFIEVTDLSLRTGGEIRHQTNITE